jgi:hypothetical protein
VIKYEVVNVRRNDKSHLYNAGMPTMLSLAQQEDPAEIGITDERSYHP